MPSFDEFNHRLVIPVVDGIHEAIVAYFQTSREGPWECDASKKNTRFAVYFIRGNWGSSILRRALVARDCDVNSQGEFVPKTKPMKLSVLLRPSPQDITIELSHEVFSRRRVHASDLKEYQSYWAHVVKKEVLALRAYLEKCYSLDGSSQLDGFSQ